MKRITSFTACVVLVTCSCLCAASSFGGGSGDGSGGVAGGGGDGIYRWTSALSGEYFDQNRWTTVSGIGAPPPRDGDRAIFNQPGPYTVTIASGGVTETDYMQLDDGNVTFRSNSTTVPAVYHLTTGLAGAALRGDSFVLGGSSRPVNMVVGTGGTGGTILYDNVIMQIRYGSLLQTTSLAISNQVAVPGFARMELSPGTGQLATTLNVTGQLTLGQHGIGEVHVYNDSQVTLGNTSFICTASGNSFSRGDLFVYDGSDVTANSTMTIGGHSRSDSTGHVHLSNPGSTITMTGASQLRIGGVSGSNGLGFLEIDDGGVFTTGTGTTTVRRSGRLYVNHDDSNAKLICNGAFNVEGGECIIRKSSALTLPAGTTVNVQNEGELGFTSDLYPINQNRTFNIKTGGRLTLYDGGQIGDGTDGTVIVQNEMSIFQTADPLEIGSNGGAGTLALSDHAAAYIGPVTHLGLSNVPGSNGTITVESGAAVNTAMLNVWSMAPGSACSVTITGFESNMFVQQNQLSVGHPAAQGHSVIQLFDSAQLVTSQGGGGTGVTSVWPNGLLHIGPTARMDSDAEVIVDGGEFRVDGTLNMLNDSWIEHHSGIISGDGVIQLTNSFSDLIVSHGTIAPGSSAGSLTFEDADLEMNIDSVCAIELGGLTPGTQHDQIVFDGGAVYLNGVLEVSFLPGYAPQTGDEFVIVTADGGVFDVFANVVTPTPMDVIYDDNDVRLVVLPSCTGDMVSNGTFAPPPDGVIDGADLGYLLGAWGRNPGSVADIVDNVTFQPPPDGVVDGADLGFLLSNWGACP